MMNTKTRKNLKKRSRRTTTPTQAPTRRTTVPKHLPKTVAAVLLRNKDGVYDPANDPEAPMHIRHGDTPEWCYQDGAGAPTLYDKNYHPWAAVQLMAEGASPIELALEFGVYPATLYSWMRSHDEFKFAVEHGRVLTKAWWMREGRKQLGNVRFNNGLYALHMANRFGWSKKNEMSLLQSPGAMTPEDEVLPKELQAELSCAGDEEIEVTNDATPIDVGRSAEILKILLDSGAIKPNEGDSK